MRKPTQTAIALLLAAVAPLSAYVTLKDLKPSGIVQVKWPSAAITYRINPAQGANITGARSLAQVFTASFGAWDNLTTADIAITQGADTSTSMTYSGNNPDFINILKTNLSQSEYLSAAGDALAVTFNVYNDNGVLVDSDILFNPGILYSTENTTIPADRYDLQSVTTHEIGHFLGLDHSSILSSTMFPTSSEGTTYARALSTDEISAIGSVYPNAAFLTRGSISGTVRLTSNAVVYGAVVVAVNSSGQPVASAITDPSGNYFIGGLTPGNYTVYAEPMDLPFTFDYVGLDSVYPGKLPLTSFTTRYR
jgi:predicted Zn-dependent protease